MSIPRLAGLAISIALLAGCSAAPTSPAPTAGSTTPSVGPTGSGLATPFPAATQTPRATGTPNAKLPVEPIDRAAVLAEPQAVAALLADPNRRLDGIVSMLASLGIGVYTPDGVQILQGSESIEDDFFLYDFEIPLLASMAGAPARPFLEVHAVLARAGFTGTPAELALGYATAFGEHPEAYVGRLLVAMGVEPGQPDLTPLQSWLLLLTLVPPNDGRPTASVSLALAGPPIARCGGIITGAGVQPLWGVSPEPIFDDALFQNAVEVYYAIHGPILVNAVSGTMVVEPASVHEGHGGPSQTSQLSVRMNVLFIPQHVSLGGCGALINIIDPAFTPVAGVPVEWRAGNDLKAHGSLDVPAAGSFTDANGQAKATFTAQMEPSGGEGTEQSLTSGIIALLPAKDIFQFYLGISDSRLLLFVPERVPVLGALTVTWHGPEPTPAPTSLAVGDPCALITQAEATSEAGEEVRPGFQVPTNIEGLGAGTACVFRDADEPSGIFGVAHIRIDVIDLGATGGGERFAAAGLGLSGGHVPDLGDDNFYFCAETCGPSSLFVRRANLAILVSDLTADGLGGATRLARLALQRIDAR